MIPEADLFCLFALSEDIKTNELLCFKVKTTDAAHRNTDTSYPTGFLSDKQHEPEQNFPFSFNSEHPETFDNCITLTFPPTHAFLLVQKKAI